LLDINFSVRFPRKLKTYSISETGSVS
jgi:hypothetical protein